MRIGDSPIRKVAASDAVYEAWADGEIELFSKAQSEWVDASGDIMPGSRKPKKPGISVAIEMILETGSTPTAPSDWEYHWRLGEGRIFTVDDKSIAVHTEADVGILRKDLDIALTETLCFSWEWLITSLPSEIAEDLAVTHDYLSLAIEFDNGHDLTYMWSAELPVGFVFRCPLDWWCERETHVVVRSGKRELGSWQREERHPATDYQAAIGGKLPGRVTGVWLIANSVFQRNVGHAMIRNVDLS
jgi:hypothetical protein